MLKIYEGHNYILAGIAKVLIHGDAHQSYKIADTMICGCKVKKILHPWIVNLYWPFGI